MIFAIEWDHFECCIQRLWPTFSCSNFSSGYCDKLENYKHYYCHEIGSQVFAIECRHCESCTSWPCPKFCRSQILKCEKHGNSESRQICTSMTFIEVNICKWNHCKFNHCKCCTPWPWPSSRRSNFLLCIDIKCCKGYGCHRQICLDSHGPRRAVALVTLRYRCNRTDW